MSKGINSKNCIKEFSENELLLGVRWYDFGWRQLDVQLGVWHCLDPMAEKYYSLSPYNYVFNNPINVVDPDGRDPLMDRWLQSQYYRGMPLPVRDGPGGGIYTPGYDLNWGAGYGVGYNGLIDFNVGKTFFGTANYKYQWVDNGHWEYSTKTYKFFGIYSENNNTEEIRTETISTWVANWQYELNISAYYDDLLDRLNNADVSLNSDRLQSTRKEPLSNGYSWVNNGINLVADAGGAIGGTFRLVKSGSISLGWYQSGWSTGNQYVKTTYSLSRLGTGIGYGTSFLGVLIGGYNFSVSDKSWGDYGQLGISLASSVLTCFPVTTPVGIGIGVADLGHGFDGFYNFLDSEQQLYKSTGLIMLPNSIGFPMIFKLK